jgi:3-deoxy-D-manno-octulosonic-acid transferase
MAMVANAGSAYGTPALIRLWMLATAAAPGLLERRARQAHRQQGADPSRLQERLGQASLPRPPGPLVWLHAASVGEVTSIARLGKALMAASPGRSLLVTTATRTGAETVARLLPGALHQFLPIDTPAAARSFLDHWRPDAALFVEADLWPRLIFLLHDRGCPMALLNARHSRSRERFPRVYAALLSRMALITVQDPALLPGLADLGLDPARLRAPGNLKADLAPQEVDVSLSNSLIAAAKGRGIWAAVSTHAPEEELVLQAHAGLPDAPLLVLVPRHPERGDAVADLLRASGLSFTRHSQGTRPGPATQVHLVDALGLTGTVFAASGLACIGGSLVPGIGGHTPYEPAALGCAILSGPHVGNFTSAYRELTAAGAARLLPGAEVLQPEVARLLHDPTARAAMQSAARAFHAAQAGATEATLDLLAPILP